MYLANIKYDVGHICELGNFFITRIFYSNASRFLAHRPETSLAGMPCALHAHEDHAVPPRVKKEDPICKSFLKIGSQPREVLQFVWLL